MAEPLSPEAPGPGSLSLGERPLAGMINLRGAPDDPAFAEPVAGILGVPLPTSPNRFVAHGELQCIWQGPDEWLLVVPDGRQQALGDQLEAALGAGHHAVTEVTGNRMIFRLDGERAIPLLSSGCSLDFAASSFPSGTAAQTILARTPVTILRLDDAPTFEIHARRSYRVWLHDWFCRVARGADPGHHAGERASGAAKRRGEAVSA